MRDTFSRLYRGAALATAAPPRATMLRGWSGIRAALSLARKQWWVKPRVRMTLGALLVAAAYYVGTLIGLSVRFQSSPISPIWPPNTIVLVALLLVPMQTWWVYLLAVFGAHLLVDLPNGIPLATSIGLYFSNCAEAVLGAFLVRSLGGGPPWLGNLRRVTVYIICAVLLAPVLTSFVDAAVTVLTHWGGDYWLNWESRTASNMLAELTIGPALLLALTARRWMRGASRLRWVEVGLLTLGVLLVSIVVFGGAISWHGSTPALVYSVLPLLLWAAIRFGTRGTSFALLGITLVATWSAAQGYGPFSAYLPDENVISLQLFLIGLCVPLLLLAGLMQEHRETERTLQGSDRRYRDLVESQTDMICRYLPNSTLTFVNDAFCRFYGMPRHRLIGAKFLDLVDDAARAHHMRYIETVLKSATPTVDEHEITLPDGSVGWQQWVDHTIRDTAGNVVEIQSIGRDITDRRRADEALKESEMRFRAAFESAATGMMLVDTTGRALQVNRPLADMLGYAREELLGRRFTELTHPDDVEPNLELFRSALAGEIDDYQLEKRFVHKQGHIVWTLLSAGVVRDAAGQPRYFIGQMQDITERKRMEDALRASEERYRAVVSNFPHGVVLLFEQDLCHIFVDGQGLPNVELSKEAVEGKRLGEVFPAEISVALEPKYQAALAGAGAAFDLAYGGRTYQTQVLPVQYGGRTAGMAIMQDVTEQRQAEVLAELDRAKTAFFSNVSHELRTPLTLLLAPAADALADREAPLPPRQRERLELIQRGGQRLHKLVDTLLTFSRIEAGHMEATYVPTDVATLTADLASAFRSVVERAGLRLVVDCPPLDDLPQPAYVDRDMWEQIVLNLISNALKFTPAGEISVSVRRTGNRDECIDECIKVEVRDTGIGIPAEDLPHIFERFYRVQNARTLTTEGTGIGLALVRDLVRLHGGVVRATSKLDIGSAFTVTIPVGSVHLPDDRIARREPSANRRIEPVRTSVAMLIAQEALLRQPEPPRVPLLPPATGGVAWDGNAVAAAQPQAPASAGDQGMQEAQEAESETRESSSGVRRPTILVADDHDDMRAYLVRLLSSHWDVRTAANGASALAAAQEHRVDLILADVIMPDLDGFGLVSTLRANPQTRALPVILLSARAGDEATVEGLQAGADDYLIKPFSSRELLARVRTHLELARARREAEAHAAQLGAIFEAIGDGVLVQDLDGRDRHANRAFRDLLRRHLELRGHHVEPDALIDAPERWEDFIAPTDQQGLVIPPEQWATARALQGEILTGVKATDEYTWGTNGELLLLNVSAAPIQNASGRITGAVAVFRDVTERRQLERRVAEQASQLQAVFEAQADGVAVFDTRGRFVRANGALREIFGIHADAEYTSRSLSERSERVQLFDEQDQLIPEEQWPQWRVLRGENLAGANAMDTRLRALDGREVWISTTGAPVYGPDREVTGVVLVTRDVTARRELERQAEEQASRLRAVFEAMTDGIAVFERFGRPVLANQAWQDMLQHIADLRGLSADPAFSALPFTDQVELVSIQTPVGPDGRVIPLERMPTNRALKGETLTGQDAVDERVEGPDGRVFESSVSAAPVRDAVGHIIGAVVVGRDVTARRALERRVAEQERVFRTLVENSPDIITRFDRDLRFLYASPAAEALTGIPAESRLGKTYAEIGLSEAAYAPWEDALRTVFATGQPQTFESGYHAEGKSPRVSRVTYIPEFAADGSVESVLGITTDITELKQTEEALRQSEERLAQAFHQSPIAMAIISRANQRILDANAAQCQLTGYSRGELVGRTVNHLRLLSPAHSGPYRGRVRREGPVVEMPVSIRTKSGEVRSCLWSMGHIQVGGEACVIVTTRDVTEREQAEESLRAAKAAAEAAQREEEQRRAEAERREQIAASLREILAILNSDRQFGKTLEYITRQVGHLLNSTAAAIYTTDTGEAEGERPGARAAQEALTLQASFGLRPALISARGRHRLSVGDAAVRRAMESRRPVAVLTLPVTVTPSEDTVALPEQIDARMEYEEQDEQVGGDATDYIDLRHELLPAPYCALLAIPIISQGQAYGSLLLLYTTPRRFSADEVALAMAYGDQIALAVANARLQDHIEREATENERNRLARELHDTVTQEIFTASVLSESIPRVWEHHRAEAEASLGEVHRLTRGALAALRALLLELRPAVLEQKALDELLQQLAEVMATRANVPIDLTIADDCPPIPNVVKVAFYRIAQEALMNTAKYANAQHIAVRLRRLRGAQEAIQLEVQDDGQGFDPSAIPAGHFGLGMMRERARAAGATLRITSRPEQGTRIAVKWPEKGKEQRRADSTEHAYATLRT